MIDLREHLDIKLKRVLDARTLNRRANELVVKYYIPKRHAMLIVSTLSGYYSYKIEHKIAYFNTLIARARVTPRDRFLDIREESYENDA